MKLLLVDDFSETLETLSMQYGLFPAVEEIWRAHDVAAAWQMLREHPIDIVSLDIHIGPEDGLKLCEQIHAQLPDLFIVMCSMDSSDAERGTASAAGASWFLEKPVSYEDIRVMLAAFQKQRQRPVESGPTAGLDSIAELVTSPLLKGTGQ